MVQNLMSVQRIYCFHMMLFIDWYLVCISLFRLLILCPEIHDKRKVVLSAQRFCMSKVRKRYDICNLTLISYYETVSKVQTRHLADSILTLDSQAKRELQDT